VGKWVLPIDVGKLIINRTRLNNCDENYCIPHAGQIFNSP